MSHEALEILRAVGLGFGVIIVLPVVLWVIPAWLDEKVEEAAEGDQ